MPFAPKRVVDEIQESVQKLPAKRRAERANKESPSTSSGTKRDKSRLARATPGQLKRATERLNADLARRGGSQLKRQNNSATMEKVYSSTQESINATPDPFSRSLRRSRRIEAAKEQIVDRYACQTSTAAAPNFINSIPAEAANWHRGSSPLIEANLDPDRQIAPLPIYLADSTASLWTDSPVLDELLPSSQPPLPTLDALEAHTLVTTYDPSTPAEIEVDTPSTESVSVTELPSQNDLFIPSSIEHTSADYALLLRSKLAKWLEDGPWDADQISDFVHGPSDAFELPTELFALNDRATLQTIVPKTRYRSSLRDTLRKLSKRFMSDEMMKKADFKFWLHTAKKEDLELFWSDIREHPRLADTSERQLKQMLKEVFPEQWPPCKSSASVSSSQAPNQTQNDILQIERPVLPANQMTTSAEQHERPVESVSHTTEAGFGTSAANSSFRTPVETRSGVYQAPAEDASQAPSTFEIVCYLRPNMTRAPSDRAPASKDASYTTDTLEPPDTTEVEDDDSSMRVPSSQTTVPELEHSMQLSSSDTEGDDFAPSTSLGITPDFVPFADEKKWRAYASEHPDMVYQKGSLSGVEKARISEAVLDFMNYRCITSEEFCALVHSGDRRDTKLFWSSLIYCLPERKPKNLREYIKKAYPIHNRAPFTENELEQLRHLVGVHGKCWATIGRVMNHWREDCQQAYAKMQDLENEHIHEGPWSQKELNLFERAVAKFGAQPIQWREVAAAVGTRTFKQCHDHGRIQYRTDASYSSCPSVVSTPVQKSSQRLKGSGRKSTRSSITRGGGQASEPVVAPPQEMMYADIVAVVDYLIALPLESIDTFDLPSDIGRLNVFGYEQIRARVSALRKHVRHWRQTDTAQTLLKIRENLLNNMPRDNPSQEI
ncbi:protein of unknown function [Taphrina deformans PYCC 5710]|uniref:Uncharacterized protein n=1 Tax=Taphrina deformans (strain PYCC 5710 / ATCC 11124 / CBS 356.35 / IMI 108563 / JCM 9778 / NBRC 8474) TaxID=1097556 RepID=R4XNK8_TAPDE|nr:protein of unknown function [Taphrina deformans PYCC 5710]|eukprot:CCG84830.1 protein of unknown function [Taphrina deformans PYCC 5710]